jgi:hypothetical protein
MKKLIVVILVYVFLSLPSEIKATDYYVSPNGSSSSNGSKTNPWDLQTALNHPTSVKAGDTIWVVGGNYTKSYISHLKGSSSSPIIVRAIVGERAILDYHGINLSIATDSYYVWFWGLEFTDTKNPRDPNASRIATGVVATRDTPASHDIKFINCYLHDIFASAFHWYESNYNSEIYGSVITFNGSKYVDHGIYVHNQNGNKFITDNLIGDNAGYGVHGYIDGTGKYLNGLQVVGNAIWNNGSIGCQENNASNCETPRPNILVGGTNDYANNPLIQNNYTYQASNSGGSLNLGYSYGSYNAKVLNNYFMGGPFTIGGSSTGLQMSGNTIWYSSLSGTGTLTGNTWMTGKPTGNLITVRPNKYEAERANIIIYNWSKSSSVTISANNLSGVALSVGDQYELHNAQNFYGDVIKGTYNGSGIVIPMTGRTVAQPVNLSWKPASTFPEFGSFVLIVKNNITSITPTPTPKISVIVTPSPAITNNLIINPDFNEGTTGWSFTGSGTFGLSTVQYYLTPPSGQVQISSNSTINQLSQSNLSLKPNTKYLLTFAAKSLAHGDDMNIILTKQGSSVNYGLDFYVPLTTSWQKYAVDFTTTGFSSTVNDGKISFDFSEYNAVGDNYFIDNIILTEYLSLTTPTITPTSSITSTPLVFGDANGDMKVDGRDYQIFNTNYDPNNSQSGGKDVGDFNNDKKVDGIDYSIWFTNYGK